MGALRIFNGSHFMLYLVCISFVSNKYSFIYCLFLYANFPFLNPYPPPHGMVTHCHIKYAHCHHLLSIAPMHTRERRVDPRATERVVFSFTSALILWTSYYIYCNLFAVKRRKFKRNKVLQLWNIYHKSLVHWIYFRGAHLQSILYSVPGFLASRPNWLPPPPHPEVSVASPLWFQMGVGGVTLARGRGAGRANSDDGTNTLVL
jgi:hypothetical protein